MITQEDYKCIKALRKNDPATYKMINRIMSSYAEELSIASHSIKNYISFIGSSYQLISEYHPEASSYSFWKEMNDTIQDLNHFMDQTTLYRYCSKALLTETNLNNLLFELPDELDLIYETEDRDYNFDIDTNDMYINADYQKLKAALIEILKNSYEATSDNDTITIYAHPEHNHEDVRISVSNYGYIQDQSQSNITDNILNQAIDTSKGMSTEEYLKQITSMSQPDPSNNEAISQDVDALSKPFYTTKSDHTGMGLSIAYKVCNTHDGHMKITQKGSYTDVSLIFPLIHK